MKSKINLFRKSTFLAVLLTMFIAILAAYATPMIYSGTLSESMSGVKKYTSKEYNEGYVIIDRLRDSQNVAKTRVYVNLDKFYEFSRRFKNSKIRGEAYSSVASSQTYSGGILKGCYVLRSSLEFDSSIQPSTPLSIGNMLSFWKNSDSDPKSGGYQGDFNELSFSSLTKHGHWAEMHNLYGKAWMHNQLGTAHAEATW